MKAITEHTPAEYKRLSEVRTKLFAAIADVPRGALFINIMKSRGYAHYKFYGVYSDKLVECLGREPTDEELIMLMDGGFSHFGATINRAGHGFQGRVNID